MRRQLPLLLLALSACQPVGWTGSYLVNLPREVTSDSCPLPMTTNALFLDLTETSWNVKVRLPHLGCSEQLATIDAHNGRMASIPSMECTSLRLEGGPVTVTYSQVQLAISEDRQTVLLELDYTRPVRADATQAPERCSRHFAQHFANLQNAD